MTHEVSTPPPSDEATDRDSRRMLRRALVMLASIVIAVVAIRWLLNFVRGVNWEQIGWALRVDRRSVAQHLNPRARPKVAVPAMARVLGTEPKLRTPRLRTRSATTTSREAARAHWQPMLRPQAPGP